MVLINWMFLLCVCFYFCICTMSAYIAVKMGGIHPIPSLTNATMMLVVSSVSFTLYTSIVTFIRAFLFFLSHLEEASKLFVKLLMGVIFHVVWIWAKQSLLGVCGMISLSSLIVCQLKMVLKQDTIGVLEEIAMGYLRISIEMMWEGHADMSVACAFPCLLGFLAMFSPPTTDRIDEQLGANFPEMDREGNHQL